MLLFRKPATEPAEGSEDESDDLLQRPALPVAGEPANEALPPEDGLEYLRRVRRQAGALPQVVRADAPAASPSSCAPTGDGKREATRPPRSNSMLAALNAAAAARPPPQPPEALRPARSWQDALLADFGALGSQLRRRRSEQPVSAAPGTHDYPDATDAPGWATWSMGTLTSPSARAASAAGEDTARSGDADGSVEVWRGGRAPTVETVSALDQRRTLALIRGLLHAWRLETEALQPAAHDSGGGHDGKGGGEASRVRAAICPSDALSRWIYGAHTARDAPTPALRSPRRPDPPSITPPASITILYRSHRPQSSPTLHASHPPSHPPSHPRPSRRAVPAGCRDAPPRRSLDDTAGASAAMKAPSRPGRSKHE